MTALVELILSLIGAFGIGIIFERYVLGPLNVRLAALRGEMAYLESQIRDEHEAL